MVSVGTADGVGGRGWGGHPKVKWIKVSRRVTGQVAVIVNEGNAVCDLW